MWKERRASRSKSRTRRLGGGECSEGRTERESLTAICAEHVVKTDCKNRNQKREGERKQQVDIESWREQAGGTTCKHKTHETKLCPSGVVSLAITKAKSSDSGSSSPVKAVRTPSESTKAALECRAEPGDPIARSSRRMETKTTYTGRKAPPPRWTGPSPVKAALGTARSRELEELRKENEM